jgi:hypothetical protein
VPVSRRCSRCSSAKNPDAGTIRVGDTSRFPTSTSRATHLDDKKNVWEEISGGNDVIYLGKRK